MERIFRAAKAIGASVQIDLKTLVVTVLPGATSAREAESEHLPIGKENWDDEQSPITPPFDGRELNAMEVLFKLPDGLWTSASTIRSFGPHSQQKLLTRGYIETSSIGGDTTGKCEIRITEIGRAAWMRYQRHIRAHPHL